MTSDDESDDKSGVGSDLDYTNIDPYVILEVDHDATEPEIKKAYRRLALIHHPDKVSEEGREKANRIFQKIVFAYSILSNSERRNIYDATGSLQGNLDEDTWKEFFDQMYSGVITKEIIEQDKKDYRESGQERRDILHFYTKFKGSIEAIFENVLHSNILEDEERFRSILNEAIENKEVKSYKLFASESKKSQVSRHKRAKKEEKEAEELAKELGVDKEITDSNSSLASLIQRRSKNRMEQLIENIEQKYSVPTNKRSKTNENSSAKKIRRVEKK